MSDFISFQDNQTECVVLAFEQPLEGTNQFGKKQFTYGIEPTITGEEKFSATEKLHGKIQELGASKGDTIHIKKVKDPEVNKGYAFFTVTMGDNPVKKEGPLHKSVENFQKQFEPKDDDMAKHELEIRVSNLEKEVAELRKISLKEPF